MQSRIKETVSYIWTIDDFINQESPIDSPYFASANKSKTFKFGLFTNMEPASKFVFVKFCHAYDRHVKAYFNYRVSILGDSKEVKFYSKEYHWRYDNMAWYNISNFIRKSKITKFLFGGRLILLLEVDILDDPRINLNDNKNNKKVTLPQASPQADLSVDYQSLFESGKLSDFIVAIYDVDGGEKQQQFRVHKIVLAARSAFFAAMFEHSETKEVKEGRVDLDDISVEACEELLRFIYTGKVTNMSEHASELLIAADKYQLEQLKHICEQSLSASLSIETAASALLLADMHNAAQLKSSCIEYINANSDQVMETDGWKQQLLKSNRIELLEELYKDLSSKKWYIDRWHVK